MTHCVQTCSAKEMCLAFLEQLEAVSPSPPLFFHLLTPLLTGETCETGERGRRGLCVCSFGETGGGRWEETPLYSEVCEVTDCQSLPQSGGGGGGGGILSTDCS